MKLKLFDYTIMSLMAGSAAGVWAAEITAGAAAAVATASTVPPVAPETEAASEGADCATAQNAQCDGDGQMLFRLKSQSYDQTVTQGTDRRVSLGLKAPGKADVRGRFSF